MAEIWGSVIIGGAALGGAYLSSQGAKKASGAAAGASDAAIAEQRREFETLLSLTAPQRAIGNQALATLGSIYGYQPSGNYFSAATAGATPFQAPGIAPSGFFNSGVGALLNPATVSSKLGAAGKILDPAFGLFGNLFGGGHGDEKRNLNAFAAESGAMQLSNGMIMLPDGSTFSPDRLKDVAGTWYGAVHAPDGNQQEWQQRYSTLLSGLQKTPLPNQGNAGNGFTSEGVPNPAPLQAGSSPGGNALTAPDYSAFFKSPDYNFRLKEGLSAVQNSAAAEGGLYSGNALRGVTEYGQGIAAGGFNDYVKNQLALAGIGTGATSQAGQGALATGANIGNLLVDQGNARASGIMGQTNSWANLINQLGLLGGYKFGG